MVTRLMNDALIVTAFVTFDDILPRASDSAVLAAGVIVACQFANHHERSVSLQPMAASPDALVRHPACRDDGRG
jgi:hypothetical protein